MFVPRRRESGNLILKGQNEMQYCQKNSVYFYAQTGLVDGFITCFMAYPITKTTGCLTTLTGFNLTPYLCVNGAMRCIICKMNQHFRHLQTTARVISYCINFIFRLRFIYDLFTTHRKLFHSEQLCQHDFDQCQNKFLLLDF